MYGAIAARSSDAGRLIGRVSKAIRFTSSRCRGEILSEVTLPPQEPHPSVIDGSRSVVNPIAPWVEGLDTMTRAAGVPVTSMYGGSMAHASVSQHLGGAFAALIEILRNIVGKDR